MNILPKTLTYGFGVLLLVGTASASTINGTTSSFGNLSSFSAGSSSSTSAAQFNNIAVNAAIQAACPTGFTCSALTLNEIDVTLTAVTDASVTAANSNGSTAFIQSIPGQTGTFGAPTSGVALEQVTTVDVIDPLANDIVDVIPTFSQATTNEGKRTGTPCTGTATSGNFLNCLAVAVGSQTYNGTGTDTEEDGYGGGNTNGPITVGVIAAYVGAGNVTFNLSSTGGTSNGTLQSGVTLPTNAATVRSGTNALEVDYLYSFTETSSTPEPATLGVLGAGLVALSLIGRKKLAKQ